MYLWRAVSTSDCADWSYKHSAITDYTAVNLLSMLFSCMTWLLFAHCTSFFFHGFLIVTTPPHHQVTSPTCQVSACSPVSLLTTDPFTHTFLFTFTWRTQCLTCWCRLLSVCRGWNVWWVSAVRILFVAPPPPLRVHVNINVDSDENTLCFHSH